MKLIKLAVAFALMVAWCGGAEREPGSALSGGKGLFPIDSILLSFTQGGDGKEPQTGFRMDIDAGMGSGASTDPMFTVYTCGMENQPFEGHSTVNVILKPAPGYKGKLDLATLEKSGGHIHIWPICYLPGSANDIGYDLWDITNVVMRISGREGSLVWNMDGPNMLVLSSKSGNEADLYFDGRLNASSKNR